WMSPETIEVGGSPGGSPAVYDMRSEVYALSILIWEIMTCEKPFADIRDRDSLVMHRVKHNGLRPGGGQRPIEIDADLWQMLERGWDSNPNVRPTAEELVCAIRAVQSTITPTSTPVQQSPVRLQSPSFHDVKRSF
ncbi:hypothetical protein CYMTET_15761, partial [Cymbomonas tetramitiformis]